MDKDGNRSNPYKPNPDKCCEACIFGSGEHSSFCTAPCPHCTVPWSEIEDCEYEDCECECHDEDRLSGPPSSGDISSVKHA